MTSAANTPIASWRVPANHGLRLVNRDATAPAVNRPMTASAADNHIDEAPNRYGASGTNAPTLKASSDDAGREPRIRQQLRVDAQLLVRVDHERLVRVAGELLGDLRARGARPPRAATNTSVSSASSPSAL